MNSKIDTLSDSLVIATFVCGAIFALAGFAGVTLAALRETNLLGNQLGHIAAHYFCGAFACGSVAGILEVRRG